MKMMIPKLAEKERCAFMFRSCISTGTRGSVCYRDNSIITFNDVCYSMDLNFGSFTVFSDHFPAKDDQFKIIKVRSKFFLVPLVDRWIHFYYQEEKLNSEIMEVGRKYKLSKKWFRIGLFGKYGDFIPTISSTPLAFRVDKI